MQLFLLTIALLGVAFAALGIKMFLIPGGQFVKQCSSVDVGSNKHIGCSCGEKKPEDRCENYEEHHGTGGDTTRHIHTETMSIKTY